MLMTTTTTTAAAAAATGVWDDVRYLFINSVKCWRAGSVVSQPTTKQDDQLKTKRRTSEQMHACECTLMWVKLEAQQSLRQQL